jgi:hypothetical protein
MKTGRIAVPAMAAGVTPSRYPGMLEPFFETGGFRRHGGQLVPGDPQETTASRTSSWRSGLRHWP